jgi:hypothetical protein
MKRLSHQAEFSDDIPLDREPRLGPDQQSTSIDRMDRQEIAIGMAEESRTHQRKDRLGTHKAFVSATAENDSERPEISARSALPGSAHALGSSRSSADAKVALNCMLMWS